MDETPRLFPDRYLRIWNIAEYIAEHPGHTRRELADRYSLSERQIQADLIRIRDEFRLPLVRAQGYRFVGEGGHDAGRCPLTFGDACVLLLGLLRLRKDRVLHDAGLGGLVEKLPRALPPHLAPLGGLVAPHLLMGRPTPEGERLLALVTAIATERRVELLYTPWHALGSAESATLRPELLLPSGEHWYLLARADGQATGRRHLIRLDRVHRATVLLPDRTPVRAAS